MKEILIKLTRFGVKERTDILNIWFLVQHVLYRVHFSDLLLLTIFKPLNVTLLIQLLVNNVELVCHLIDLRPLRTALLHALHVNFVFKLLHDLDRISFTVNPFVGLLLSLSDLSLDDFFEWIKLPHYVLLTFIQCILHLVEIYLRAELANEVLTCLL